MYHLKVGAEVLGKDEVAVRVKVGSMKGGGGGIR